MSIRHSSSFMTSMLLSTWMALVPFVARGQENRLPEAMESRFRVTMPPTEKVVGEERHAQEFRQVLSKDLSSTGPFEVLQGDESHGTSSVQDLVLNTKVVHGHTGAFKVSVQIHNAHTGIAKFRKSYEGPPDWIRRMAHRVADDVTETITGKRGISESRIVFSHQIGPGIKEIFQVDRDGDGLTQLTQHQSLSESPSLSPDGRLAYITYKGGPPEIWGQRKLGGPHLKLYPIQPSRTWVISSPTWSPVGNQLAFVESDPFGGCDVMVLDLDHQKVNRLTSKEGRNTEPAWDPSGKRIAFTSDRGGTAQIYVMRSDGGSPRPITARGFDHSTPSWKPDGSQIAYDSHSGGHHDVFVWEL